MQALASVVHLNVFVLLNAFVFIKFINEKTKWLSSEKMMLYNTTS